MSVFSSCLEALVRAPWVGVLGAAVFLAGCGQSEPVHEGKKLSQWIRPLKMKAGLPEFQANVDGIVAFGEAAVPTLIGILDHVDADKRCGCAAALLRINREIGLAKVRPRIESGSSRMQISMAYGMVWANVEPGLAVTTMARNFKDPDYYVRNESIKVFGELGPQSTEAVPALATLLRNDDVEVRWRAAYALVRVGSGAVAAVPALRLALGDTDAKVREGAAFALGAVGPAAKEAFEDLQVAANDNDPKVRFRASKALEKL